MPSFPDRLRAAMNKRRLSGAELARLIEVDRSTIWRYLHGKDLPRPAVLEALERVLKTKLNATAKAERNARKSYFRTGESAASDPPPVTRRMTITHVMIQRFPNSFPARGITMFERLRVVYGEGTGMDLIPRLLSGLPEPDPQSC